MKGTKWGFAESRMLFHVILQRHTHVTYHCSHNVAFNMYQLSKPEASMLESHLSVSNVFCNKVVYCTVTLSTEGSHLDL